MRIVIIYLMENKYIMSNDTTSIATLPLASQASDPVQLALGNNENMKSENMKSENINSENIKIQNYGQQLEAERVADGAINPIDYTTELNSVLKDAAAAGATVLPSRDIPSSTLSMQHDQITKPNFVPTNDANNDYIGNIIDREREIRDNQKKQNHSDNIDYIYQQLQIPILVGIIYFLFQLPVVRKHMLAFLPNLFNKDGNPNLSGYVFNSIMFALLYALLLKGLSYINN